MIVSDIIDKKIIQELQDGIILSDRPYEALALKIGITEPELFDRLNSMKKDGRLRRIGAVLGHRKLGYSSNAMIVWQVPAQQIAYVAKTFAAYDFVTHCYRRESREKWPYNLYTVVHGKTREDSIALVECMAKAVPELEYKVLFSSTELKKTAIKYYIEEI